LTGKERNEDGGKKKKMLANGELSMSKLKTLLRFRSQDLDSFFSNQIKCNNLMIAGLTGIQ